MNLEQRRVLTQKTLDTYRGVVFSWDTDATATCAHLAHLHLTNAGHSPPDIPEFHTAVGAKRALRSLGHESMVELFDAMLPRRPSVAHMRMGDVAIVQGEGGLDAVLICAGPLKVFGWREDASELVIIDVDLNHIIAAWEV